MYGPSSDGTKIRITISFTHHANWGGNSKTDRDVRKMTQIGQCSGNGGWQRTSSCLRSDFDHLEIGLGDTTIGTCPGLGHILPACARRDVVVWPAFGFMIKKATDDTHESPEGRIDLCHGLHRIVMEKVQRMKRRSLSQLAMLTQGAKGRGA